MAATSYTGFPTFIAPPGMENQRGLIRIGGYWRFIAPSAVVDALWLFARYIDTRDVDISCYQRGVARGATVAAGTARTFRLVVTRMVQVPDVAGYVVADTVLWSQTTAGRHIGFDLPRQVWDLGEGSYVVGLRLEVAGEVVGVPSDQPTNAASASVSHDWMPWALGPVTIRLAAPPV